MKTHKISKATYTDRANKLRKLGYEVTYKGNKVPTAQQKSAVTKLWFDKAFYYHGDKASQMEFRVWRGAKQRASFEGLLSEDQVFKRGYFLQRPKGIKKGDYRIRVKGKAIEITTRDGRKVRDSVVRLDMVGLLRDSKAELQRVLKGRKRPRQIQLTVNGWDRDNAPINNLEDFNKYLEFDLLPKLTAAKFNFEKYGQRVFGLKMIYSTKGQKHAKNEGKIFDFKTGSIFDASSKVVYGKRKSEDRSHTIKTGKRKGK